MCLNPIVAKDHEKVNYTIGKKSCYSGFGVHAVRNVNPNTRIFILSILPMRNDRLVNNTINETNRAIKKACQQQIFAYIDNDSNFLKNGKPDITMYKDAVNLNKTGGNFLGSNIREPLKSHLHTQPQREEEPWKSSASDGFSVSASRETSVSSEHDDATLGAVLPSLVSCSTIPLLSDMEIDSDFQSECITCETNDTQHGYTQNTSDMSMRDSETNIEITFCSNLSENCSDVFDNSLTENIPEAQGMSNISESNSTNYMPPSLYHYTSKSILSFY